MASSQRILQILCLLCLHVLSVSSLPPKIGVIGLFIDMTSPDECTQVSPANVYIIECLQWMTDYLNNNNYFSNITLKIEVVDICKPKSSIRKTMELIKRYKNGPEKLIGFLSISTSEQMLDISWFLSNLPPDLRHIQIGTKSTAYQLSDRSRYPTLFRVIQDDNVQIELIVKLLLRLKWNYIAILHERDIYGEEGAELLSKRLPSNGITLAVKLPIYDINEEIFILSSDYSNVQGVVIIAQEWTVRKLKKDKKKDWIRFIMTEAVTFDDTYDNLDLFESSFFVKFPQVSLPNMEKHWETLFNINHINSNLVFRQMIEQSAGCPQVINSTCDLKKAAQKLSPRIHKDSMLLHLVGLYTFAFLLKMKQENCKTAPCPSLTLELEDIQDKTIDFSYLSQILNYPAINLTGVFNEQGNLIFQDGFRVYDLYNVLKGKNRFEFKEVGYYDGNKLSLDMSQLRALETWGTCPPSKNCRTGKLPKFIYRRGDIMLFGVVPVRSGNRAINCPSYDKTNPLYLPGEQLAEAMLYAVEQLNEGKIYKNLFPGKKLGIVIMDSCYEEISSFKSLLSFWKGTAGICQTDLKCLEIIDKILVFIGALGAEVSTRIKQLAVNMNRIQISYGSTSTFFRGPMYNENLNFLRVVPSDAMQIVAMVDICLKMKWHYISMIFMDSSYGRSAELELRSKARQHKICVTLTLMYKKGDSTKYLLIELKRRPEAKVVIVFVNTIYLEPFMKSLTSDIKAQDFIFLGSETWGRFLRTSQFGNKIAGSLSLALDVPVDPAFDEYLMQKRLGTGQDHPWREAAMESHCYIPLSLNKLSNRLCRKNITLKEIGKLNQWSNPVIQSVYAAAVGLNMSIAQLCSNVDMCTNLFNNHEKVIDIFKDVKLKGIYGNEKKVFDKRGDGTLGYNVYQIKNINKNYVYIKIGKWSQESGLTLNTKQIDVPPLTCPNRKRCKECELVEDPTPPMEDYILPVIVFVFLLLLLAVVIFIFWKYRDNHEEDSSNEVPEIETIEPTDSHIYTPMKYLDTNADADQEETELKKARREEGMPNKEEDNEGFDENNYQTL